MAKILTDEEMITLIGQYMTGMQRTVSEEEIDNMLKWAEQLRINGDPPLDEVLQGRRLIRFADGRYETSPKPPVHGAKTEEQAYFVIGRHHMTPPYTDSVGVCGGGHTLMSKAEAEELAKTCEMTTIAHSYRIFKWEAGEEAP